MTMAETLPHASLSDAVKRAAHGARSIVTLGGVDFGVVPVDDAKYMDDLEDEYDARVIREIRASGEPRIRWETLKAELDAKHGIYD